MKSGKREFKLAWWIDHTLNVLFRGGPDDGRASMMKAAFDHARLRLRFFAARAVSVERLLADTSVEAVFIGDLDRTPKMVRLAVMQLLRFKSINGECFPCLKGIWAAVSLTDDEDAGAEDSDPPHAEPFDVVVDIPSHRPLEH